MAKANQKQSNGSALNFDIQLGKVFYNAMGTIERENPTLKGVLPRDYAGSIRGIDANLGPPRNATMQELISGKTHFE
jgi:hypothetical protein